jgi:hypothetical protein
MPMEPTDVSVGRRLPPSGTSSSSLSSDAGRFVFSRSSSSVNRIVGDCDVIELQRQQRQRGVTRNGGQVRTTVAGGSAARADTAPPPLRSARHKRHKRGTMRTRRCAHDGPLHSRRGLLL